MTRKYHVVTANDHSSLLLKEQSCAMQQSKVLDAYVPQLHSVSSPKLCIGKLFGGVRCR